MPRLALSERPDSIEVAEQRVKVSGGGGSASERRYFHQMMLPLPFADDEELPADRLSARESCLQIRDPPVVDVDAARLHQPPRLALRRRELGARDQIDDADAVAGENIGRQVRRRHVAEYREHVVYRQRRDVLAE